MSASRLLISIVVLTVLFAAGKVMVRQGSLLSGPELPDVQPAIDHGGGTATARSTQRPDRLDRLESNLATLRKDVARIAELESTMLQLEDRVAALSAALAERGRQEAYVDDAALPQRTPAQSPPEATPADDDGHLTAMRSAFLNDTIDPGWAMEASALVTGFFDNGTGDSGTLRAVDCRSQYCRVAVGHENRMAADEMALRFAMHVAGELPEISYHYERQSDGYTDVIMYLRSDSADSQPSG